MSNRIDIFVEFEISGFDIDKIDSKVETIYVYHMNDKHTVLLSVRNVDLSNHNVSFYHFPDEITMLYYFINLYHQHIFNVTEVPAPVANYLTKRFNKLNLQLFENE